MGRTLRQRANPRTFLVAIFLKEAFIIFGFVDGWLLFQVD
jgi:hypothetical protein